MPFTKSPHNLGEVPRNDLDAAQAYYEYRGNKISANEWHILFRLQADPAGFEKLSADWNVRAVREGDQS